MTSASLKFSSDLLRRLGEELTPSPVNGIIELAKNAYDADARTCIVEIHQPTEASAGQLVVRDDGDGMRPSDLKDGWLVLGTSRKDNSRRTRLGRVPAGNKGLGRLTALRMGNVVTVETCSRASPRKLHTLTIDWRRYDRSTEPQSVPLEITTTSLKRSRVGTLIRVEEINTPLSVDEIRRLNRGLLLIQNPFTTGSKPFRVELTVDPEPAKPFQTLDSLFGSAQYRLEAKVSRRGATAKLFDSGGGVLFESVEPELAERIGVDVLKLVPPLTFRLWMYLLQPQEFDGGHAELTAVRKWLKEFGGVHVFVDDVRVSPYGDPGDDWVGMNALRAGSPELLPQTGSALGYVALGSVSKQLRQKTDRSGFIDSPATEAIRDLVRGLLRWQQAKRLELRERQRETERESAPKASQSAFEELRHFAQSLGGEVLPRATLLVEKAEKASSDVEASLRKEVELYRTLGTAGIAASVFAHEATQNPLGRIASTTKRIRFKVRKHDAAFFDQHVSELIDRVLADVDGLEAVSAVTLALVRARKRKKQRVALVPVAEEISDLFGRFFSTHGIQCVVRGADRDVAIFGVRSAFESILVNLMTNSIQAFDRAKTVGRRLEVTIERQADRALVRVDDSGPGIHGLSLREIFLPGETTREEGTGLGLTIVASAARDLGGKVRASATGVLGGAAFTVDMPCLPE